MTKPLTRAGIVESAHNRLGLTKTKCSEPTDTLLEIIKSTLESGEDVMVSGFGKFCVKDKRERMGRNPATGNDLILAPRRVVTFRCSGRLRDRLSGG